VQIINIFNNLSYTNNARKERLTMLSLWSADKAKAHKWYRKPLDECTSSNGNQYSISLKKGIVNKLLVNFIGGGLSWSEETANNPITISSMLKKKEAFYINNISNMQLNFMHIGILNANDKRNPFRDWYILNIPYSTADFHIGNNDYIYRSINGDSKTLFHRGEKNAATALNVLHDFFPKTPDTLLIMGESAGAFGCVAHSPAIKNIYPNCKNIIVYSEGSHIRSPLWQEITKSIWKVNDILMKYIKSEDLIFDLFIYARDNMPSNTIFMHSNSVWDKDLVAFMNKMNNGKLEINATSLQEFNDSLKETVNKLKREIPNYSYYLTDYGMKKDGTSRFNLFIVSFKESLNSCNEVALISSLPLFILFINATKSLSHTEFECIKIVFEGILSLA
jgi:hypothetical protein